MTKNYPLISCICITNNRPELLQKAIECFESQNYPNKELVISYPQKDHLTKQVISTQEKSNIRILAIEREDEESLGNARNQAIIKCKGEYVCIWDDDDWYHSSRLSFQFNSMQERGQGFQASILTRILLYDTTTQQVYLSFPYSWEGTILCRKVILLQNQYKNSNIAEDSHVVSFLSSRSMLFKIEHVPYLYIYIYHGNNTWNYKHFESFLSKSELITGEDREHILSFLGYLD
jgi:glycosyltransferase involved in cell wall biosynthesis